MKNEFLLSLLCIKIIRVVYVKISEKKVWVKKLQSCKVYFITTKRLRL